MLNICINDNNNILIETRTSNFLKSNFHEDEYEAIRDLVRTVDALFPISVDDLGRVAIHWGGNVAVVPEAMNPARGIHLPVVMEKMGIYYRQFVTLEAAVQEGDVQMPITCVNRDLELGPCDMALERRLRETKAMLTSLSGRLNQPTHHVLHHASLDGVVEHSRHGSYRSGNVR